MRCQKLETLNPSVTYSEHKKYFKSIKGWLNEYYKDYQNSDTIISLLDYWLYTFRCIVEIYGEDGVIEFSKRNFESPARFAYHLDFGLDVKLKKKPSTYKKKYNLLFKVISCKLKNAYLPGGRVDTLFKKILWRLTKYTTSSMPINFCESRKNDIVNKIYESLGVCDSELMHQCINDALPSVFYADQVEVATNEIIDLDCSASAFMDFCGYEDLLLLSRKVFVVGRQHGGGYNYFTTDYWLSFEEKLCDRFIGWGMSEINEKQHRYPSCKLSSNSGAKKKRLIWVETSLLPSLFYLINPSSFAQHRNIKALSYIYNEIHSVDLSYFNLAYPGKMRSPSYDGMRGKELPNTSCKGESEICVDDIVIFDICGSSLIHYCIENRIIYVVIISRNDVPHFTEVKRQWFEVLRDCELVFYDDDYGLLSEKLIEISSMQYIYPKKLEDFHNEIFINI